MSLIQQIKQIYIPVKELDRAVQFYRETLEVPFLFQAGKLAFFDCGGVRLMLSPPENEDFATSSPILYLSVESIDDAYVQLKNVGVSFIDQPHLVAKMDTTETWMSFFRDSEHNLLALLCEKTT
ncbi:VOC family protein [Exiguobacterium sp. s37]|uniref:VOC family protein n=1 Tax=Exiguobacterium sp. s37 TaxID=2751275 RepID=UPI001BE781D9|nr:VOC family protein [Exiguobacterium sp. s37]